MKAKPLAPPRPKARVGADLIEDAILCALLESYGSDFPFQSTKDLCAATGLHRDYVLAACRSLRRAGLAEFKAGLWTEWGDMFGSGYAATKAGSDRIELSLAAPDA